MLINKPLQPVKNWFLLCLLLTNCLNLAAQQLETELQNNLSFQLLVKSPGNPSEVFTLKGAAGQKELRADKNIPLQINREVTAVAGGAELNITIEALADAF